MPPLSGPACPLVHLTCSDGICRTFLLTSTCAVTELVVIVYIKIGAPLTQAHMQLAGYGMTARRPIAPTFPLADHYSSDHHRARLLRLFPSVVPSQAPRPTDARSQSTPSPTTPPSARLATRLPRAGSTSRPADSAAPARPRASAPRPPAATNSDAATLTGRGPRARSMASS